MVKPRYPVLDCRSDITGLSTWDLEVRMHTAPGSPQTCAHQQARPHALSSPWTHAPRPALRGGQGVTTTRSEARRKVKSLLLESWRACGVPTILVGHALNHDLEALRLDHQPCIDTALIFCYQ